MTSYNRSLVRKRSWKYKADKPGCNHQHNNLMVCNNYNDSLINSQVVSSSQRQYRNTADSVRVEDAPRVNCTTDSEGSRNVMPSLYFYPMLGTHRRSHGIISFGGPHTVERAGQSGGSNHRGSGDGKRGKTEKPSSEQRRQRPCIKDMPVETRQQKKRPRSPCERESPTQKRSKMT